MSNTDELKQKALDLLNALPKCHGPWIKGSGGHKSFGPSCGRFASYDSDGEYYCETHLPRINGVVHPSIKNYLNDIPYIKEAEKLQFAVNNRNTPTEALMLSKYERDNLLCLIILVAGNYIPGTNTGDWVGQLLYKLSPNGKLTEGDRPNRSIQDFINGIIKDIIE